MSYRKGGDAHADQKVFPSIVDYVKLHHPGFYEIIDNLGLKGNIVPRRNGSITLLIPEKATIAQLRKLANSDDPTPAVDAILAHILLKKYDTSDEFKEDMDDISTQFGTKLLLKEVKGGKVITNSGAELVKDTKYKPLEKIGNATRNVTAVWMVKGTLDTDGPETEYKNIIKKPMAAKSVKGGDDPDLTDIIKTNLEHIEKIGLNYDECCVSVCKVLGYWLDNPETYANELLAAKALFGLNMCYNAFILFRGARIFNPKSVYTGFVNGIQVNKHKSLFEAFMDTDLSGDFLTTNKAGFDKLCNFLDKFETKLGTARNPQKKAQLILELYNAVSVDNAYETINNVFPTELHKCFKSVENLLLQLNEIRYELCFICRNDMPFHLKKERLASLIQITRGITFNVKLRPYISVKAEIPSESTDKDVRLEHFIMCGFILCHSCCTISGADDDENDAVANESMYTQDNKNMDDSEFSVSEQTLQELKKYVNNGGDVSKLL